MSQESEEGFALMEAVGVLFISALIVVVLAFTVSFFTRASAVVVRQANMSEVLMSGLSAFRREISGTLALPAGPGPKDPVLFRGSPSAIGFVKAGEVVWIRTAVPESGGALMRAAHPAAPGVRDLGSPDFGAAMPLIAGPWTFRISYSVFDGPNPAWVGEWTGRNKLPDLVKLDVFRPDGRGRPLMSLITAPHMRWDRRCAFDDPNSCLNSPMAGPSP